MPSACFLSAWFGLSLLPRYLFSSCLVARGFPVLPDKVSELSGRAKHFGYVRSSNDAAGAGGYPVSQTGFASDDVELF